MRDVIRLDDEALEREGRVRVPLYEVEFWWKKIRQGAVSASDLTTALNELIQNALEAQENMRVLGEKLASLKPPPEKWVKKWNSELEADREARAREQEAKAKAEAERKSGDKPKTNA